MKYVRYEYELKKKPFFEAEISEDSYKIALDKYNTYTQIFTNAVNKNHEYTKELETEDIIEIVKTFIQKEKEDGIQLSEILDV